MTMFWISTAVLTVVACAFIALPFIKRKENNDDVLRDELNKAFYKDRLAELQEESSEGLVENQQDLIADLKQSLLDDIPEQQETQSSTSSTMLVVIPSVLLTVGLSYLLYAKFGAFNDVEQWHEVNNNLPELSKKLMGANAQPLSDDEMQDLTLALRTRLHHHPDDATGWLLLGRLSLGNRDAQTALEAMRKAYRLKSDDADITLGYAQALMLSQDELDQATARSLLGKLVTQDYVDLRVFSLLAFDAFERQDFPAAIKYWGIMQQMIGPEDRRYAMLEKSIQSARKQMGEQVTAGNTVAVTVQVANSVNLDPNAVLIVSIHPGNGAAMPVAAARFPLGEFPRTVMLDDGNSMLEGQKLSALDQIMVRARIDSDGNVATREGDWFGESETVSNGEQVTLTINQQY